jgi:hypothetical protein
LIGRQHFASGLDICIPEAMPMDNIPLYIKRNAQRQGYLRVWCVCGKLSDTKQRHEQHVINMARLNEGPDKHHPSSMIEARFNSDFEKMMEQ